LKRSIPFAFVFVLLRLVTEAQDKSFTDYYFEAKAIADSLKTYQVLIQVHDTTFPFVSNDYVKNEIGKSFNFLNTKKRVDKDPDFIIRIMISDVEADVIYSYQGRANDDDVYEIVLHYDVSFALSFETSGKTSVHIPICTKKHFRKKHNYYLRNADLNSPAHRFLLQTKEEKKPVHIYAEDYKTFLNTRASFIIDFNEELARVRKKKK
jgi:hypothetical protein